MGVHGLWKILEPTADPVKLEALRGKTLAIDASIWIYHFLKAMRDPKGTVMVAAHIIGFFRRICKLIFFEIKPVFVFDGAAPVLKKMTTSRRSERRLTREQAARSAANKLLTIQLQRAAGTAVPNTASNQGIKVVGSVPKDAVYFEDLVSGSSEPVKSTPFVPTDQYHLPEMSSMAAVRSNDQRLLSEEELEEYSRQFTDQAHAGFIDTSLVDFHSREFEMLPPETQYQLLSVARTKSRLRMGYSAEELNEMFPDSMEFSKFQINRVAQRNFFTQKLINLMGMEEDLTRRVSGEKNKEYFLKKTDQGYSLSLEDVEKGEEVKNEPFTSEVGTKKANEKEASEKEASEKEASEKEASEESEDEFEDVDISPEAEEAGQGSEDRVVAPEFTTEPEPGSSVDAANDSESRPNLDEIFGFEARLTRQRIFDKMYSLDSDNEGDEIAEVASKQHEKKSKQSADEEHVPEWFSGQSDFQEMRINEVQPEHFVPLDYEEPEESDGLEEEAQQPQEEVERAQEPQREVEKAQEPLGVEKPQKEPQVENAQEKSHEGPNEPQEIPHEIPQEIPHEIPQEIPHEIPQEIPQERVEGKLVEDAVEPTEPVSTAPSKSVRASGTRIETNADLPDRVEAPVSAEEMERANEDAKEAEEEDEDIAGMLIAEAEENERFAKELASQNNQQWSREKEQEYEAQIKTLRSQFTQASKDADNVSTEMIQECQELLQLFGIPYVTAPAEAEAQCAELHALKLVDGVVTDDGDTFLFENDAKVYRNMFSQARFVEFYSTKRIHNRLGLSRRNMIDLAFLLGSDYTDGVLGIGPVTGVEILAEFGDLKTFAEWWRNAQRFPDETVLDTPLKRRLMKNFQTKLYLPDDFPNQAIVDAYLHPAIDSNAEEFRWGAPDLDGLRRFMQATAGWDREKTDGNLLPVVQEAKRHDLLEKTQRAFDQSTIDDFYHSVVQNPNMGSKRAAKAAGVMRKKQKN